MKNNTKTSNFILKLLLGVGIPLFITILYELWVIINSTGDHFWEFLKIFLAIYYFILFALSIKIFNGRFLQPSGQDYGWMTCGLNTYGQLGLGHTISIARWSNFRMKVKLTSISSGNYHTVGLAENGSVWSWGSNCTGELGIGRSKIFSLFSPNIISTPQKLHNFSGEDPIITIHAGGCHTIAKTSNIFFSF